MVSQDLENSFNEFYSAWRLNCKKYDIYSNLWKYHFSDFNYLAMISLGKEIIPYVLKELEKNSDYFCCIMFHLADSNPTLKAHAGKFKLISEDWIKWGKEQGYQW